MILARKRSFLGLKTGCDLLTTHPFKRVPDHNLSISIVMPAFKSHNTINLVLQAISRQHFVKRGGKLEVIISDDCSSPPLLSTILKLKKSLDIKYIYSFNNRGAGSSRDDAIKIAQNNIIIFIDSDIIIPPNFVDNHALIHSTLSSENIIVSFRENVFLSDKRINDQQYWEQGNMELSDHRTDMVFKSEWVMKSSEKKFVGKRFNILKDTACFKDLGFGRKYYMWTLPMMALTCAMSAPASLIKKATPVPKKLFGWGFNDTCMAVKMIAHGAKLIPNLNSTVLHLLEKKHTKSDVVKNREFIKNEKIYKDLLNQKYS